MGQTVLLAHEPAVAAPVVLYNMKTFDLVEVRLENPVSGGVNAILVTNSSGILTAHSVDNARICRYTANQNTSEFAYPYLLQLSAGCKAQFTATAEPPEYADAREHADDELLIFRQLCLVRARNRSELAARAALVTDEIESPDIEVIGDVYMEDEGSETGTPAKFRFSFSYFVPPESSGPYLYTLYHRAGGLRPLMEFSIFVGEEKPKFEPKKTSRPSSRASLSRIPSLSSRIPSASSLSGLMDGMKLRRKGSRTFPMTFKSQDRSFELQGRSRPDSGSLETSASRVTSADLRDMDGAPQTRLFPEKRPHLDLRVSEKSKAHDEALSALSTPTLTRQRSSKKLLTVGPVSLPTETNHTEATVFYKEDPSEGALDNAEPASPFADPQDMSSPIVISNAGGERRRSKRALFFGSMSLRRDSTSEGHVFTDGVSDAASSTSTTHEIKRSRSLRLVRLNRSAKLATRNALRKLKKSLSVSSSVFHGDSKEDVLEVSDDMEGHYNGSRPASRSTSRAASRATSRGASRPSSRSGSRAGSRLGNRPTFSDIRASLNLGKKADEQSENLSANMSANMSANISAATLKELSSVDILPSSTDTLLSAADPHTSVNPPPDGPEFREKLEVLEAEAQALQPILQAYFESAEQYLAAVAQTDSARRNYADTIAQLKTYAVAHAKDPDLSEALSAMHARMQRESARDEAYRRALASNLLVPRLWSRAGSGGSGDAHDGDLARTLAAEKKRYAEKSKDYYAWLGKRLTKNEEDDEKYLKRRRSFELARVDYYDRLRDFAPATLAQGLYALLRDAAALDAAAHVRAEDGAAARAAALESQSAAASDAKARFRTAVAHATTEDALSAAVAGHSQPDSALGLLWLYKGRQGWRKEWVTLEDNGVLVAQDWRGGKTMLDVLLCCVRIAGEDRRFCFEVMTTKGDKRLFQAALEAERSMWVARLSRCGPDLRKRLDEEPELRGEKNNIKYTQPSMKSVQRESTLGALGLDLGSSFLDIVRNAHPSNAVCADCGGSEGVDWILVLLLVVVCIDCLGVHRSLGLHVLKIRLLTLDVAIFTPEIVKLLHSVANSVLKSYWEKSMPADRSISLGVSLAERTAFIIDKYREKAWVVADPKANLHLIYGIHLNNVHMILKSLACGGNPNMVVIKGKEKEVELSLLEYALTHYSGTAEEPVFEIAELLLLNGANCGSKVENNLKLIEGAKEFWQAKIDRLLGISREIANEKAPEEERTETVTNGVVLKKKRGSGEGKLSQIPRFGFRRSRN